MLIADPLAPEARAGLEALGLRVTEQPDLTLDTLPGAIGTAEVLVVRDTAVTRRALERAEHLVLIVVAGASAEAVDLTAASERAIFVATCPGYDAQSRAELALGQLIALDRLGDGAPAEGLATRWLGLYGLGPMGQQLAPVAAALGMGVRAWSPALTPSLASERGYSACASPAELFRRSDVLSLHVEGGTGVAPLTAEQLAALPEGGVVLAMEGLTGVPLPALADRVEAGHLRAAVDAPARGLDTATEAALERLAALPGARVTRSAGDATAQAQRAAAVEAVRVVHQLLHEGTVGSCVNATGPDKAVATLVVRHRQETSALLAVFDALADEGIGVLEIRNTLLGDAHTAALHLRLDSMPRPGVLDRIRRQSPVFQVEVSEIEA